MAIDSTVSMSSIVVKLAPSNAVHLKTSELYRCPVPLLGNLISVMEDVLVFLCVVLDNGTFRQARVFRLLEVSQKHCRKNVRSML